MTSFQGYGKIRVNCCVHVPVLHLCLVLAHPPDAASAPGLTGLAAEEGRGPELASEHYRRPADAALNAETPAAVDFSSEVLPACPAEHLPAHFVLPAA